MRNDRSNIGILYLHLGQGEGYGGRGEGCEDIGRRRIVAGKWEGIAGDCKIILLSMTLSVLESNDLPMPRV